MNEWDKLSNTSKGLHILGSIGLLFLAVGIFLGLPAIKTLLIMFSIATIVVFILVQIVRFLFIVHTTNTISDSPPIMFTPPSSSQIWTMPSEAESKKQRIRLQAFYYSIGSNRSMLDNWLMAEKQIAERDQPNKYHTYRGR